MEPHCGSSLFQVGLAQARSVEGLAWCVGADVGADVSADISAYVGADAAFCVFTRFQVTDFDVFILLCSHFFIFPFCYLLLVIGCGVSSAEQHFTTTQDVAFWDQVV